MKTVNVLAQILIVVGAINWGLIAWFDFNLVTALFGVGSALTNVVYTLVGIAGLYGLYLIVAVSRGTGHAHAHGNLRNTERHEPIAHDGGRHARH